MTAARGQQPDERDGAAPGQCGANEFERRDAALRDRDKRGGGRGAAAAAVAGNSPTPTC